MNQANVLHKTSSTIENLTESENNRDTNNENDSSRADYSSNIEDESDALAESLSGNGYSAWSRGHGLGYQWYSLYW